jgi:CheY-like chemotaxis protein
MTTLRLLVVEDHRDTREAMAALLEMWGYEVAAACTAEEALHAVALFAPDAAIVDLPVPDMDGTHLAWCLAAAMPARRPVLIALWDTSNNGVIDRPRVQLAGFDCFMFKPADPDDLHAILQTRVARRRVDLRA